MSPFRKLLCAFGLCQTFRTNSDDDGIWGECGICGHRVGYVTRAEVRRHLEREYAATPTDEASDDR